MVETSVPWLAGSVAAHSSAGRDPKKSIATLRYSSTPVTTVYLTAAFPMKGIYGGFFLNSKYWAANRAMEERPHIDSAEDTVEA